ncbi:hypothetical protein HBA55_21215 [Pseudomaricurvus alkylphenolicus]|jgi:uncharacterized OB-fold protein|uniref:Zn-ribbon domain-containing OB-fold protein n=1 Tax=Pseudomaricurvus alkylphenolicus TaxID=1306991 RepID=UPI00141D9BA3|nr:OB-fold domain-containing protein [Pseudomaricurvus alkylphenolicus]NIB42140.1 hypothetical protein [Pseudomaricurvus alkylphenolicus]
MTDTLNELPPLTQDFELGFTYTRSLGPVLSRFLTGLRDGQVLAARTRAGTLLVPPPEFEPVSGASIKELEPVAAEGTVLSWCWVSQPSSSAPLNKPFAWVLVRFEGCDGAMLHALAADAKEQVHTGMRVRVRWAPERVGNVKDIACFEVHKQ